MVHFPSSLPKLYNVFEVGNMNLGPKLLQLLSETSTYFQHLFLGPIILVLFLSLHIFW